jgi:hypothetical protein
MLLPRYQITCLLSSIVCVCVCVCNYGSLRLHCFALLRFGWCVCRSYFVNSDSSLTISLASDAAVCCYPKWRRNGVVGIVTRSGIRMPAGARDVSVLQNVETGSVAHQRPYSMGAGGKAGSCWCYVGYTRSAIRCNISHSIKNQRTPWNLIFGIFLKICTCVCLELKLSSLHYICNILTSIRDIGCSKNDKIQPK